MILDWFNAGEAVTFGREIAREIDRLFPPGAQKNKQPIPVKKDQKKLNALIIRTRTFAQQHKLNIYKKAKLLNTIKWELRDGGHEDALIDEIIVLLTPVLRQ